MRRLVLIASLAALIVAGTTQSASALVAGIGDQNASTFSDPAYRALHVKRTRLIVAWNAINSAGGRSRLDQWMNAARAANLKILVAFNPDARSRCPARPCTTPSPAAYTKAFKAFRKRYPFVTEFNFWNETNSPTQPTGSARGAQAAAKLYIAARKVCGRRCTVTGPDILDLAFNQRSGQQRVITWVNTFLRAARSYPRIWGFHNYQSTNYNRPSQTTFFLRSVARHGQVWVTETGGIVQFRTKTGKRTPFSKYDEKRAARAIDYAYSIARKNRGRITRLYFYQWRKNNAGDYFDAGIERFDGKLRPAYANLKRLPKSLWK